MQFRLRLVISQNPDFDLSESMQRAIRGFGESGFYFIV
jgi:hypothetical protein